MNRVGRFLAMSAAFYAAACAIVLRAVPTGRVGADASVSALSSAASQTSAVSAASGAFPASSGTSAASAAPMNAVAAPTAATFDVADISHHDVISDWAALKSATSGLYMKATEGATYVDPMLDSYTKSALGAGLPVGFFHYFWPTADTASAENQATHFYRAIQSYAYSFYPAVDVEETNNLTAAQISAATLRFCQTFEKLSGHSLLIYCSRNFADKYLTDSALSKYGLWVADYNGSEPTKAGVWKSYAMWQYTNRASLPGVPNPMDANHATSAIVLPAR